MIDIPIGIFQLLLPLLWKECKRSTAKLVCGAPPSGLGIVNSTEKYTFQHMKPIEQEHKMQ